MKIPVEVAYDYDKFVKVQRNILEELGCLACCSGWDIRWDIENRFVVDKQLNVSNGF